VEAASELDAPHEVAGGASSRWHGLRRAPGMELDALVAAINDPEQASKQTNLNKQNKF
jgi:hypothetical protein